MSEIVWAAYRKSGCVEKAVGAIKFEDKFHPDRLVELWEKLVETGITTTEEDLEGDFCVSAGPEPIKQIDFYKQPDCEIVLVLRPADMGWLGKLSEKPSPAEKPEIVPPEVKSLLEILIKATDENCQACLNRREDGSCPESCEIPKVLPQLREIIK